MSHSRPYRHPCVADLAWAVSSPPLLLFNGKECEWFTDRWYRDQFRHIEGCLRELDHDPIKLESLLAAQKDQRLGNYFETLWCFALQLNPRYQLIERNLQIHDGERTLGEMDFIVLDTETGCHAHWELAIKFYLGLGDTVSHDAWLGPGKKDRLDLKLEHLLNKQTLLSTHPVAKAQLEERGIVIDNCGVIFKGRLFYPPRRGKPGDYPYAANPSHLRSQWLTRQQFLHSYGAKVHFMPLIRSGWMAVLPTKRDYDVYSKGGLMRWVDSDQGRLPLHVVRLERGIEQERLFIVDNHWPGVLT